MESFIVKFDSYATFDQMLLKKLDETHEVVMFCQEHSGLDDDGGEKEIIFSLKTESKIYKDYDLAQFSITEKEARLLINTFRFHFGIKDL